MFPGSLINANVANRFIDDHFKDSNMLTEAAKMIMNKKNRFKLTYAKFLPSITPLAASTKQQFLDTWI